MAAIGKLDVAWVSVSDWDRAREFYGKVLGLKETLATSEMGWAEMTTGADTRIAVSRFVPDQGQPEPGRGAVPVLTVKNLDAAMSDLESKGVTFLHPPMDVGGMGRLTSFQDPDGNMLQLYQSTARPPRPARRAAGRRAAGRKAAAPSKARARKGKAKAPKRGGRAKKKGRR